MQQLRPVSFPAYPPPCPPTLPALTAFRDATVLGFGESRVYIDTYLQFLLRSQTTKQIDVGIRYHGSAQEQETCVATLLEHYRGLNYTVTATALPAVAFFTFDFTAFFNAPLKLLPK